MMKKKVATLAIAGVLAGVALAGGTLAYLTDTDEKVNTMTLGNVAIEQYEYQRALDANGDPVKGTVDGRDSYMLAAPTSYEQDRPLLPAIIPTNSSLEGVGTWDYDSTEVRMSQVGSYGGAAVFNTPNAQDKFVTVKNTGKSDAYVRTLVAFEVGAASEADMLGEGEYTDKPLINWEIRAAELASNKNRSQPWTFGWTGFVTVENDTKYLVYELIYTGAGSNADGSLRHKNGVLPAGDTTYPSLCQVYMASWAGNDEVEALDGNNNGKYDILVLSQAVQAEGFASPQLALNSAFGAVNAETAAAWLADVE